jgi:hypothetical protein
MLGAGSAKHPLDMYEPPTRPTTESFEILLDGRPITLPGAPRSLSGIRTYLEMLALENERVLCTLSVDGRPAKYVQSPRENFSFTRIEARTVALTEMPLRMLETALQETAQARAAVASAITLVLINDSTLARELWWNLARQLKEPLLTLSLLPETIYQPAPGGASLLQVRKWQLQQLAVILKAVDEAGWDTNPDTLSNALEQRALPWLDKLHEMIHLWHQTVLAGVRSQRAWDRDIDQRPTAST